MKIIVLDGPHRGRVAPLAAIPLVVGSDAAAGLSLPRDPRVAAFHCQFHWDERHCWVEDLEGSGRTLVHGKRPSNRILLVTGDVVTAGETRMVVAATDSDPAAILGALPTGGVVGGAAAALAPAPDHRPGVLVVDDDIDILFYIQVLLQHRGYDVVTALDGEEALIRIHERTPDLIVSDIQMPRMDGFSLLRRIRKLPGLALVPLIVLTVLDFDEISRRSFSLGADDCVSKERLTELEPRIAQALRRRALIEATLRNSLRASEAGIAPGIAGNLEQVPVPALLGFLQLERMTGVLVLSNAGDGEIARLQVRDGAVIAARLDRAPEPRHAELVFLVIGWVRGSFAFTQGDVVAEDEIRAGVTELLIEAACRQDEVERRDAAADEAAIDRPPARTPSA